MRRNRKTVFCDIDGTLFEHKKDLHAMITETPCILPGVIEKFKEWRSEDYYIVLTTARPKGCRSITEKQLSELGIFYDDLIMGLPVGERYLINDKKPTGLITSYAVCIERNAGLKGVKI